ncbi:MAG: hypothetical protein EZS28_043641, partial [Streblomastix strix]
ETGFSTRLGKAIMIEPKSIQALNVTDLERFQQIFQLQEITCTCDHIRYKTNRSDVEQFIKFEELIIEKDYLAVNVPLVPL